MTLHKHDAVKLTMGKILNMCKSNHYTQLLKHTCSQLFISLLLHHCKTIGFLGSCHLHYCQKQILQLLPVVVLARKRWGAGPPSKVIIIYIGQITVYVSRNFGASTSWPQRRTATDYYKLNIKLKLHMLTAVQSPHFWTSQLWVKTLRNY